MSADPQLIRAILRDDLYSFIRAIFPVVSPGEPFAPNWHIEAIAYQLTRLLAGEINRLIITVPPRSLKSICTSVAFPAFVLGRDHRRAHDGATVVCVEELIRVFGNRRLYSVFARETFGIAHADNSPCGAKTPS